MRSGALINRPALRLFAVLPLLLAVAGCSSEIPIPEFLEVTYTVDNQSLGTVTDFLFIDDLDQTRVIVPGEGEFSVFYLKPKGQRIRAAVEGTVWDGTITLTITVVGDNVEFTRTDSCEDLSGQEVPCSLEIPEEVL